MTNVDLKNFILTDEARIVTAISSGSAWEIWMQVELWMILFNQKLQVARETPYPAPYGALHTDLFARDNAGQYVIELKVESATNAAITLMGTITTDMNKISVYVPNPGIRWVVGIAYSDLGKSKMQAFAAVPANRAIYAVGQTIGVLIVTV